MILTFEFSNFSSHDTTTDMADDNSRGFENIIYYGHSSVGFIFTKKREKMKKILTSRHYIILEINGLASRKKIERRPYQASDDDGYVCFRQGFKSDI